MNEHDRIAAFFASETFSQAREYILSSHRGFILRTTTNDPWTVTEAEVNDLLHEHAPELSAVLEGPTIVLYYDTKRPKTT